MATAPYQTILLKPAYVPLLAEDYVNILFANGIWNEMFAKAVELEKKGNSSDLILFGVLEKIKK